MNELHERGNEGVDRYVSKKDLAQRLDVSTRTIEEWMRLEKLPATGGGSNKE